MEEGLRRSNRPLKLKKDDAFEYDEEVLEALTAKESTSRNSWQRCTVSEASDENESSVSRVQCSSVNPVTEYSEIDISPSVFDSDKKFESLINKINNQSNSALSSELNKCSQSVVPLEQTASAQASVSVSNQNIENSDQRRKCSSTDLKFLGDCVDFDDIEGNFLSADMSGSEFEREALASASGNTNNDLNTVNNVQANALEASGGFERSLMTDLVTALDKIDLVVNKVDSLESLVLRQNQRIAELESSRSSASASEKESKSKGRVKC